MSNLAKTAAEALFKTAVRAPVGAVARTARRPVAAVAATAAPAAATAATAAPATYRRAQRPLRPNNVRAPTNGGPGTFESMGRATGAGLDRVGTGAMNAFNSMGGAYTSGARAAKRDGAGRMGQLAGGVGRALTTGAQQFHAAGGTNPMLAMGGVAAAGYGASRLLGQQQQAQPQAQYTINRF